VITVHHLENSRSQRVLWLLEELGVNYQIELYKRDPVTSLAPPELETIHPLGKSPIVTDGKQTIAESGAILEYIVDHYGPHWRPAAGTPEHQRYTYWLHFAEGTAMPALVMSLVFNKIKSAKMPFFAKPIAKAIADNVINSFIAPNIAKQLTYIDEQLSQRTWFCGDQISAADIQMSFVLEAAAARGGLTATVHPNAHAWLQKVKSRRAYKKAIERGGPFVLGQ
jgi:glutathione S-transferase